MPSLHAPDRLADTRVLVVDDNEDVLTAIRLLLVGHVAAVQTATSPASLPTLLREHRFDVVLLDMNYERDASSGREGLEYLDRLLRLDPDLAVIMITAYGDVELAVRAMKRGAVDFVTKPWDNARLLASVGMASQVRRSRLAQPPDAAAPPLAAPSDDPFAALIGTSDEMRRVVATLRKVAQTDANVLLLGENGTGKEVAARALHAASHRAGGPFVTADLGALSESLFESELFGYAKGAFTGAASDREGRMEAAGGGTLFLDEIANTSPGQQARLLTALQSRTITRVGETQSRPVDVRLVSATNADLSAAVAGGRFRQDLIYRINTVEVRLPPLRERPDDLPVLAEHFLARYARQYDRSARRFSADSFDAMRRYAWPGNVRELQHTVERAVVLGDGETLRASDLSFSASAPPVSASLPSLDLEDVERTVIRRALSKHGGNISRAADELGLTRASLYRRIEKYGL
jgi:DNA-binding NtrC family response regulator